jgi:RHS repeat-associated protein
VGTFTRNTSGQTVGIAWDRTGGGSITSDVVVRSRAGRVIDRSVDGVDPHPSGANYSYDTVGRLVAARAGTNFYQYGFAASGGCGAAPAAGKNANRTSITVNGTVAASFCYDSADRLTSVVSSTDPFDDYTGNPLTGLPDNATGRFDNAWLGQHQRRLDHTQGLRPVIQMGARPYDPLLARFLRVDPIEGGNTNDYDYCSGDPIGCTDLDGQIGFSIGGITVGDGCPLGKNPNGSCRGGDTARSVAKVTAVVGGIAGAAACGASIVCGIAVGAAAAGTLYLANHSGRQSFSMTGLGANMAIGGALGTLPGVARFARRGGEISIGANLRVAPFGNRTGHLTGRWPHYHRRVLDATGEIRPGGGLRRHRPWDRKSTDTSFWNRF